MPPKKPRKTRHLKVFGYLLNPHRIYQQAVADGTAIKDQLFSTVTLYMYEAADRECIPTETEQHQYTAL